MPQKELDQRAREAREAWLHALVHEDDDAVVRELRVRSEARELERRGA